MTTRFDPYARRTWETYRSWCERLLSCPILGAQAPDEIAELSGADESSLRMYAALLRKGGWQPPSMLHLTPPRSSHEIDDALAALSAPEPEDSDDDPVY